MQKCVVFLLCVEMKFNNQYYRLEENMREKSLFMIENEINDFFKSEKCN